MLDNNELRQILPQEWPFLLLDKVEEIIPGKRLVAVKNITHDEWPFADNMQPDDRFPETLLIEAAAQAALVFFSWSWAYGAKQTKAQDQLASKEARSEVIKKIELYTSRRFFIGKVKAVFNGEVNVGDQIKILVRGGKMMAQGGYSDVYISLDDNEIAKIEIFYSLQS